jgi:putative tryptophan/tyrosine transport system substrate-binding protein
MWPARRFPAMLLVTLALSLLMAPAGAAPLAPAKIRRIAVLGYGSPPSASAPTPFAEAFRHELQERGWVEGDNIAIEWRQTEGGPDQFATLADEVVQLKVDVIVVPNATTARVVQRVTATIPIVVVGAANFVEQGLVASLARPGGNITGLSTMGPEIVTKRLELFKQAVPGVTRVAVLRGPSPQLIQVQALEGAARALELELPLFEVHEPTAFDSAFAAMTRAQAQAVFVLGDPYFGPHRRRIADLATQQHLPTACAGRAWAVDGCLLGYAVTEQERVYQAAAYVDKILHGAKPADLPVEQATKFDLVINLKTAQALGLTIPPTLLFQADEILR